MFLTAAKTVGARAEINMDLHHKGYHISEVAKTVKIASRAVSSVGLKPNIKVICGGTDATNYNKKGIETAVIGTGGKAAHGKDENIAVADMEKAVNIIQYIFKEFSIKG